MDSSVCDLTLILIKCIPIDTTIHVGHYVYELPATRPCR